MINKHSHFEVVIMAVCIIVLFIGIICLLKGY